MEARGERGPRMRAVLCSRGLPPPARRPVIKGAHSAGMWRWKGGPGWNGAVATEEEAVAVSLGCYLLAHFESPAASCTPCHSHWSCPGPPPPMALQTPSPPPPPPFLSLSHNVRCVKGNLPPAGCPERSEQVLCYYNLGLSDYRLCVCMCACRVFKGKSLLTYRAWSSRLVMESAVFVLLIHLVLNISICL